LTEIEIIALRERIRSLPADATYQAVIDLIDDITCLPLEGRTPCFTHLALTLLERTDHVR